MFAVSAIQIMSFVLVGNSILGIQGMYLEYWFILFSAACFANILGLNISSTFDSAVTIYILIPFLVIPQLMLSGVIVKFEKLNPTITIQDKVPFVGEIMVSKWAFEALAVKQFKDNKFNQNFFYIDKDIKTTSYRKNFWLSRLKDRSNFIKRSYTNEEKQENIANGIKLLYNEISKENAKNQEVQFENIEALNNGIPTKEVLGEMDEYLADLNRYYIKKYNEYNDEKDQLLLEMNDSPEKKAEFIKLKDTYANESLEDLMTNKNDLNKIIEWENELIQRADPVYKDPDGFRSHYLASSKKLFGSYITTFSANLMVIWGFSIFLAITLYYDALRKLLDSFGKLFEKKKY